MTVNYREKSAVEYMTAARIQKEVQQYKLFKRLCVLFVITLILLTIYIITY